MKIGDRVRVIHDDICPSHLHKEGVILGFEQDPFRPLRVSLEFGSITKDVLYNEDELEVIPKNTLIVIGWIGTKRCYLNLSREEAIRRYIVAEDLPEVVNEQYIIDNNLIEEFSFDDEFQAYDAWK